MRVSRSTLAAMLALVAVGCGGSQGNDTGKVTVLLKDSTAAATAAAPAAAPAEVTAAVVTIAEIYLVGEGGKVVLPTTSPEPITTNLRTLANDLTTLVQGAVVPAGSYSQLRFVITGGYLEVGGLIYASSPTYEGLPPDAVVAGELRMPSYDQSGLKVILPPGFAVGADSTLVVDFDVTRSYGHVAGNSGAWVMHPVIKATELGNPGPIEETGSIVVTLSLGTEIVLPEGVALSDFQAVLTPADVTIPPILPIALDGSGTATFPALAPGNYDVSLQAPPEKIIFTTDPPMPLTVTVTPGFSVAANFQLINAEPPPPPPVP